MAKGKINVVHWHEADFAVYGLKYHRCQVVGHND